MEAMICFNLSIVEKRALYMPQLSASSACCFLSDKSQEWKVRSKFLCTFGVDFGLGLRLINIISYSEICRIEYICTALNNQLLTCLVLSKLSLTSTNA